MSLWGYIANWFGGGAGPALLGGRVDAPANPDKPAKPSKPAERPAGYGGGIGRGLILAPPGYAKAPPGNPYWWWVMSGHPTIAYLYSVFQDALSAAPRACKVLDPAYAKAKAKADADARAARVKGLPAPAAPAPKPVSRPGPVTGDGVITSPEDAWAEALDAAYKRHWPGLVAAACGKLLQGYSPVEKVYGRVKGPAGEAILPTRFKPWRPWEVGVLYDAYGDYAGVRYNNADVDPRYAPNFVNERRWHPLTGRPALENCREEWWHKVTAKGTLIKLDAKASGIIPIVKGPADEKGKTDSQAVAAALARGEPVFMPRTVLDEQGLRDAARGGGGAGAADLYSAYEIDFFDAGDTAGHADSVRNTILYLDNEMAYAFCVPPRSVFEGQHGTKAEAGVHSDRLVQRFEALHAEIVAEVNEGSVRTDTVTNRGPGEADRYGFEAAPMADPQQEFLQKIAELLIQSPATGGAVTATLDLAALLKRSELPVDPDAPDPREQVVADKASADKARADALAKAAAGGANGPPGDGRPPGANGRGRMAGVA